MRGKGQTLITKKLPFSTRKNFSVWEAVHWSRLHREVVESSSLDILKNHLDTILCNVLWDDPA